MAAKFPQREVGARFKEARKRLYGNQDALAERVQVTRNTISAWETGKTRPDERNLLKLCDALGLDPEEHRLLGEAAEARDVALDAASRLEEAQEALAAYLRGTRRV